MKIFLRKGDFSQLPFCINKWCFPLLLFAIWMGEIYTFRSNIRFAFRTTCFLYIGPAYTTTRVRKTRLGPRKNDRDFSSRIRKCIIIKCAPKTFQDGLFLMRHSLWYESHSRRVVPSTIWIARIFSCTVSQIIYFLYQLVAASAVYLLSRFDFLPKNRNNTYDLLGSWCLFYC